MVGKFVLVIIGVNILSSISLGEEDIEFHLDESKSKELLEILQHSVPEPDLLEDQKAVEDVYEKMVDIRTRYRFSSARRGWCLITRRARAFKAARMYGRMVQPVELILGLLKQKTEEILRQKKITKSNMLWAQIPPLMEVSILRPQILRKIEMEALYRPCSL